MSYSRQSCWRSALWLRTKLSTILSCVGIQYRCDVAELTINIGLLATTTANPEPLNALASLYSATSATRLATDKPYVDPTILRYYVVLHDVRNGDLDEYVRLTRGYYRDLMAL